MAQDKWLGSRLLGVAVLGGLLLLNAMAEARAAACFDNSDPSRTSPVRGNSFMAAAANPLAVMAGCDILKDGGSAIDAAVAVQAVLTVVEPQASGLAGGALIMYWDNAEKRVRFFDGLSSSPQSVTNGLRTPTESDIAACGVVVGDSFSSDVAFTGRAFGVPGMLRVLELAHGIFGNKPWNDLFNAGINFANNGFPMPQYMNTVLGETAGGLARCKYPDLQARYCVNDSTPNAVGTTIFNTEIASVLTGIRDGGADAFYDPSGTVAPAIVARAAAGPCKPSNDDGTTAIIPSLVTVEDFAAYEARERNPICRFVMGHIICSSAPPAFGGTAVLYMLALMDRGGIKGLEPGSLAHTHLAIEASRLAQADRREYIGDPDFTYIRVQGLLDEDYLNSRSALFSSTAAIVPLVFGFPPGGVSLSEPNEIRDMTSHVVIVDSYGNALSMTTTNNSTFGTQMEAEGIILNNVQTNFTRLDSFLPGAAVNQMESRKRARTAMAPTLVVGRNGKLKLVVGAAGGGAIPDYVAQTILGVVVHDLDPQSAINQPHFSGQAIGFPCPNGPFPIGPRSEVESGTALAALEQPLKDLGHPCARDIQLRSGLAAIEVKSGGRLLGAADPRRDGVAIGE